MAITKNQGEKLVILGAILIPFGFVLTGFWKPLSIVIGVLLVVAALVAC